MSREDRERWDERYRGRGGLGEPPAFLLSLDDLLPRRGRALDVAGGAGAGAAWLARRGLDVTLVDISAEALALARTQGVPLTTLELDLDVDPLPPGPFELIYCHHFLDRRIYRSLGRLLSPGGLLAVCHQTRENLLHHPHPGPRYLLEPGELPSLLPGVERLSYEERWWDEGRHEARFIGRSAARANELVRDPKERYTPDVASEPLVLVVDDYEDTREMYAEFLELAGFRVLQAEDGEQAVRLAIERHPHAVVMDLSLPKVDGREATRRLKAAPDTAGIPVIIMTGLPPENARVPGAAATITKPCSPEALVAELHRLIV